MKIHVENAIHFNYFVANQVWNFVSNWTLTSCNKTKAHNKGNKKTKEMNFKII